MTDIRQELKDKIKTLIHEGDINCDYYLDDDGARDAVYKVLEAEFGVDDLKNWAVEVRRAFLASQDKYKILEEYKKKMVQTHLDSLIPEDRKALIRMYFEKIDGKIPECDDILDDSSFVDFVLSGGGIVNADWYEEAIKDKAQNT